HGRLPRQSKALRVWQGFVEALACERREPSSRRSPLNSGSRWRTDTRRAGDNAWRARATRRQAARRPLRPPAAERYRLLEEPKFQETLGSKFYLRRASDCAKILAVIARRPPVFIARRPCRSFSGE